MSDQFLQGFSGFCEYAKLRLQVGTQNLGFVVRLLLMHALSRCDVISANA